MGGFAQLMIKIKQSIFFMELKEILDISDELNLYLVDNGLKAAAMISLDCLDPSLKDNVQKTEKLNKGVLNVIFRIDPIIVKNFKSYLDHSDVEYKPWEHENVSESWDSKGNKTRHQICYDHRFYIGKDKLSLDKLIRAGDGHIRNKKARGLALGYPIEAIKDYGKLINGELRDGSYLYISLAKAKNAGIELPTWLAYINFIPEKLDLVNGDVSETSKALGEKYQKFVRKNNLDLAKRVEQHFLDRKLPDSWEKAPDGGYTCCYKFQPNPNK